MKILSKGDTLPEIPINLAVCPICDQPLIIEDIDEWHTGTGRVTEGGFHITCSSQPDFDSDDFDEWIDWHYSMPYVDWLPVQIKVYRWFDKRFRLADEIREYGQTMSDFESESWEEESEAAKLEAAGYQSLFDLNEVK